MTPHTANMCGTSSIHSNTHVQGITKSAAVPAAAFYWRPAAACTMQSKVQFKLNYAAVTQHNSNTAAPKRGLPNQLAGIATSNRWQQLRPNHCSTAECRIRPQPFVPNSTNQPGPTRSCAVLCAPITVLAECCKRHKTPKSNVGCAPHPGLCLWPSAHWSNPIMFYFQSY